MDLMALWHCNWSEDSCSSYSCSSTCSNNLNTDGESVTLVNAKLKKPCFLLSAHSEMNKNTEIAFSFLKPPIKKNIVTGPDFGV